LAGIATINDFVDAGIMWQLILRRTDLSPVKAAFIADPRRVGRQLMSQIWR
jgi:phenylglyoxylate dehydrogenase epsilon subunit